MTTFEVNLPNRLAKEAREEGLLTTKTLAQLLKDEIRRRAARRLLAGAKRASAAGSKPIPMDEITAEVKAVRAHKKLGARKLS